MAFSFLVFAAILAQGPAPGPPVPEQPLHTIITAHDYPAEAIARREQGRVRYTLSINADGRVSGCTILQSSGSAALDAASCRLLRQRARFSPARDVAGRPEPATVEGGIQWRLPEASGMYAPVETAFQVWMYCALAQATELAPTTLSVRDVTRRAFAHCRDEESEAIRQAGTELAVVPIRNTISRAIEQQLSRARGR